MHRRRVLVGLGSALAFPMAGARFARAAGTTLKQIKDAGVLRVGVEASYVPFTFRKDGKIVGYDPDLADLICADLGVKAEMIDTAWAGVIPSLYAQKFDIIMTSLSYTAERMQRVGYSIPYAEASQVMMIRASDSDKIKSVQDLNGKIVSTKLGAPSEQVAKKLDEQLKASGGKGFSEIKAFNDDPSRYLALAQNRTDALFNTLPTLAMVLKDQPGVFAIIRGIGSDNWAGIAARKEDTEIIDMLNAQIRRVKANGDIYRLQEKWFGFRMNLPDTLPAF